MTFEKGKPRHANAGRKKGSKNKVKVLKVTEVLASNNTNPVQVILDEMPNLKPYERVRTMLDLLKYLEPQLKQKEVEEEPENPEEKTLKPTKNELKKLIEVAKSS